MRSNKHFYSLEQQAKSKNSVHSEEAKQSVATQESQSRVGLFSRRPLSNTGTAQFHSVALDFAPSLKEEKQLAKRPAKR